MVTIKNLTIDNESFKKIIGTLKKHEPLIWYVLKSELKDKFPLDKTPSFIIKKIIFSALLVQLGFLVGGIITFLLVDIEAGLIVTNHIILTVGYFLGFLTIRKIS
jgi:hypothetical protein|tara:strand:- start:5037 stop:5351 length:315 start_codon:yes stop_codon:yes gene_type:complete